MTDITPLKLNNGLPMQMQSGDVIAAAFLPPASGAGGGSGGGGGGTAYAVSVAVSDAMWQAGCPLIPAVAGKAIVIVGVQVLSVEALSYAAWIGYAPIRDTAGLNIWAIETWTANQGGNSPVSWCCYGSSSSPPSGMTTGVGEGIVLIAQPNINSTDSLTLIQLIYILQ